MKHLRISTYLTLVMLLTLGAVHAAEQERFELRDGRTLIGVYDEARGVLSVEAGSMRADLSVKPGDIRTRTPLPIAAPAVTATLPSVPEPHQPPPQAGSIASLTTLSERCANDSLISQLQPAPAALVEVGPLAYVPYVSWRTAMVEVNIYGDPASPCAVEVGLYPPAATNRREQMRAMSALIRLLMDRAVIDRKPTPEARGWTHVISGLDLDNGDQTLVNGWLIDITTPDKPDAFGAWWIGISLPDQVAKASIKPEIAAPLLQSMPESSPAMTAASEPVSAPITPGSRIIADWSPTSIEYARQSRPHASRVWVSGFTRRNGTYVSGHSRRR